MKFLLLLLALMASLSGAPAAAGTVYIGGTLHTLSKSDFVASGNNYSAYIDVIGDYGQELIFDIDGIVGGQGYQQVNDNSRTFCIRWEGNTRLPENEHSACLEYRTIDLTTYGNDFRYVVELQVSCNGMAIGLDTDDKNELVNGQVTDRYREVKLLVGKQLTTGGNCQQLKVEVKGLALDTIDNISLDVLIAEIF
ncbi:hypothetical protein [Thalassomonas actiniarum]|uniref:Uncharacterized protein n=1 Tax=Thalassomonas actiniarum TaxID=485447 RepID=A0AAE9YQ93_9GAMM|nr:hypothetical protein [Thalassomonas actiniarum]WDD99075.1 hypothetical protein SG35_028310 [Thalassomonas actiniarum]